MVREAYQQTLRPKMLDIMIFEGLKFIVPVLVDGTDMALADDDFQDAELEVPWVFRDKVQSHMLDWLLLPMGGTKAYLPKPKAKAKAKAKQSLKGAPSSCELEAGAADAAGAGKADKGEEAEVEDEEAGVEEQTPKRRRTGEAAAVKPRGKAKGSKVSPKDMAESKLTAKFAQEEEISVQVADGSREKYFLDDVDATLMSPLACLPEEEILWPRIGQSVSSAYKFLWTAKFDTPGVGGWKMVREQLQMNVIKAHIHLLRPLAEQRTPADVEEAAKDILHTLIVEEAREGKSTKQATARLAELSSDRDLIMGMVGFLGANDGALHPRFHPTFRATFEVLVEDEEQVST